MTFGHTRCPVHLYSGIHITMVLITHIFFRKKVSRICQHIANIQIYDDL